MEDKRVSMIKCELARLFGFAKYKIDVIEYEFYYDEPGSCEFEVCGISYWTDFESLGVFDEESRKYVIITR